MIIDSHQHFWEITREDCAWPTPDLKAIYRSFVLKDYHEQSANLDVTGTVLVQSQPCDSDTDYLLALADRHEFILAVVGWADLEAPDVADRLASLAAHKKLRGLRPMLQAIEDSEWILGSHLQPGIDAMLEQDLRFDALIQPRHLSVIHEFARRNPGLPIVVDHAAKPGIARQEFSNWATGISNLAALENVYCKLSGLLTEAAAEQVAQYEVFAPYVKHLLSCFGAGRLMWGSDWPVVNLATSLREWLQMAQSLLVAGGLTEKERSEIFSGTASRFYGLDLASSRG